MVIPKITLFRARCLISAIPIGLVMDRLRNRGICAMAWGQGMMHVGGVAGRRYIKAEGWSPSRVAVDSRLLEISFCLTL